MIIKIYLQVISAISSENIKEILDKIEALEYDSNIQKEKLDDFKKFKNDANNNFEDLRIDLELLKENCKNEIKENKLITSNQLTEINKRSSRIIIEKFQR